MSSFSQRTNVNLASISAPVITSIVGFLYGAILLGITRMIPTNTSWIIDGDRLSNQIVWNYFRRSDFIQWPLNKIPDYGVGWSNFGHGSNILLSVPLKYVNFVLPDSFQFLGIWLVICCALQGFFAAKILSLYSASRLEVVLLSCNFLIFPVFLLRVGLMGHPQLAAQWLLLCGFYFSLDRRIKFARWRILLMISLVIDLYIAAMLIAMFITYLVAVQWAADKKEMFLAVSRQVFVVALISLTMLYSQGYFSLPNGVSGSGFFRFSMTTFINPKVSNETTFSSFFNWASSTESSFTLKGDAESFLYLGAGFICFLPIFLFFRFRTSKNLNQHMLVLLAMLCAFMFLFGLSDKVSFLGTEFRYWWPDWLIQLRTVFRSTTRFGWPLGYFICLLICIRLLHMSNLVAVRKILIGLLLSINVIDISPLVVESYRDFRKDGTYSLALRQDLIDVFSDFSSINLFPVFDLQVDDERQFDSEGIWRKNGKWQDVMAAASELGLVANFAYVSRPVGNVTQIENHVLMSKFDSGRLGKGELFVFTSEEDAARAAKFAPVGAISFIVEDLFFVGVPN